MPHAPVLALLPPLLLLPSAPLFPAVLLAPMPPLGAPALALPPLGWKDRRTRFPSPPPRMAMAQGQLQRRLSPCVVLASMPSPQQHQRLQRIDELRYGVPHRPMCPHFCRAVRVHCTGLAAVMLVQLYQIAALPPRKRTLAVVAGHCCCSTLQTVPTRERLSGLMRAVLQLRQMKRRVLLLRVCRGLQPAIVFGLRFMAMHSLECGCRAPRRWLLLSRLFTALCQCLIRLLQAQLATARFATCHFRLQRRPWCNWRITCWSSCTV